MQTMLTLVRGECERLVLPDPDALVAGVPWGRFDEIGTPAYWKGQCWQAERLGRYADFRLGRTLVEETAACLLGGFGMPAETGLAAYRRLVDRDRLTAASDVETIEADLAEPLAVRGRLQRYRFPKQKARYLVRSLRFLDTYVEARSDLELRDDLTSLPGIGPKTASWIVRNHRRSDEVAILDVHVVRAGQIMGIFPRIPFDARCYARLEAILLQLARSMAVRASLLDNVLWNQMRLLSGIFAKAGANAVSPGDQFVRATEVGVGRVAETA